MFVAPTPLIRGLMSDLVMQTLLLANKARGIPKPPCQPIYQTPDTPRAFPTPYHYQLNFGLAQHLL
jgi:hypothetical protein